MGYLYGRRGFLYYLCIVTKKTKNMKTIDFENADMILRGFIATGCRISSNDKYNKYGIATSNLKETKTVHIKIIHPEMGLISFFIVSKNTYVKLKKHEIL